MMRALFDVNLLIALHDRRHVDHSRAHTWWDANRHHGWASCPLTQNGFVRIISQPRYPDPLTVIEAIETLRPALEDSNHQFWPDDVTLFNRKIFRHRRILGPRQLTDLYLLGLAVKHGGRLATFDGNVDLGAVATAEARHLTVL